MAAYLPNTEGPFVPGLLSRSIKRLVLLVVYCSTTIDGCGRFPVGWPTDKPSFSLQNADSVSCQEQNKKWCVPILPVPSNVL